MSGEAPQAICVDADLHERPLTARQVARLLAIPLAAVHAYTRRHTDPLPCGQVGRQRRFYRSDVGMWLAMQRQ